MTAWRRSAAFLTAAAALLPAVPAFAQSHAPAGVGIAKSPDSIDGELQERRRRRLPLIRLKPLQNLLDRWDAEADRLHAATGLRVGVSHVWLVQRADSAVVDRSKLGVGDDFKVFARWDLVNRGGPWPGALYAGTQLRNRYGETSPGGLGKVVGSDFGTVKGFTRKSLRLTDLAWHQGSRADRVIVQVGRFNPDDIFDTSRYSSTSTTFLNTALVRSASVAMPDFSLGAAVMVFPTDRLYVAFGMNDASGETDLLGNPGKGEYFEAVEIGFDLNRGRSYAGQYHLTLWHMDAQSATGQGAGHGLAVKLEQELTATGRIVGLVRFGYGFGSASRYRITASAQAFVKKPLGDEDSLFGIGLGWGRRTEGGSSDEYVLESFYRISLLRSFQITFDLQFIFNPANNPGRDVVTVGSVRFRILY